MYFLDDHLFGNRRFAEGLFDGVAGMGRVFQVAATVDSILAPGLLERAVGGCPASAPSLRHPAPTADPGFA